MLMKNKKFYVCWKCVLGVCMTLSMVILFLFMMFKLNIVSAHAQEILIPSYESTEARARLLEYIVEGKFSDPNTELEIEQVSNKHTVLLKGQVENNLNEILVIPKVYDEYKFPVSSSWKMIFDQNNELNEVRYYLQDGEKSYIQGHKYLSSMEFSVFINNTPIYTDIAVPISIRNFIRMPFRDFVNETHRLLYLDWFFSDVSHLDINEKARNMSVYLDYKLGNTLKHKIAYASQILDTSTKLELRSTIAEQLRLEVEYISAILDYMLQYVHSQSIETQYLLPIDKKGHRIPYANYQFVDLFLDNIISFLNYYPDFYTSMNIERTIPFYEKLDTSLTSLYTQLYLSTAQYPGVWYIVPIFQSRNINDTIQKNCIAIEVLIPYFTANGTFHIFGYEAIEEYIEFEKKQKALEQYIEFEKKTDAIHTIYTYELKEVLRVPPNKYQKSLIFE